MTSVCPPQCIAFELHIVYTEKKIKKKDMYCSLPQGNGLRFFWGGGARKIREGRGPELLLPVN